MPKCKSMNFNKIISILKKKRYLSKKMLLLQQIVGFNAL